MHYGDLNNLFYKNPSAILESATISSNDHVEDGNLKYTYFDKMLPNIVRNEDEGNHLILKYSNKISYESNYMIFPLETPCLNIKGKIFQSNQLSLTNINEWLLNISDYPILDNGDLNPKLRVKFRINDELIEGQTVELHDNDIVEVKIVGF